MDQSKIKKKTNSTKTVNYAKNRAIFKDSQNVNKKHTKLNINFKKTCSCSDSHINCLTAKEWARNQVAIWELYYEKRDIRDKDIHPAVFPIAYPKMGQAPIPLYG